MFGKQIIESYQFVSETEHYIQLYSFRLHDHWPAIR